ncbi:hypothetical protein DTO217A2_9284 [Paecilomyces variotii]|nr:hypothetical protein DTO217A2_9284 [Paecilomyces variotii]
MFRRAVTVSFRARLITRRAYSTAPNAPLAEKLKINGDRLWDDIHYTAQFSAPSPGGVTRLCADENDKKVRDWFRDQVLALGAKYTVNATGTQIATFEGEDNSIPPIAMGSHLDTVATGGRFDGPLGVSPPPPLILFPLPTLSSPHPDIPPVPFIHHFRF